MIEDASINYLSDIVKVGADGLTKNLPGVVKMTATELNEGVASAIFQTARKLLFRFQTARVQRLPEWIVAAETLYQMQVRPLFKVLVGLDPRPGGSMTGDQINEFVQRGGLGFAIDAGWHVRQLPPSGDWPSGWRPIVGKNQFGVTRRAK
jgi:hypothetical protein